MEVELTGRINRILREAITQAKKSKQKMRHGAVVFKGGKIITSSHNKPGFSKYSSRFRPVQINSIHAECNCLSKLDRQNCSLLVIRLNSNNELCNSKPCEMCMSACFTKHISYVYYPNHTGKIVRVKPEKVSTYKLSTISSINRFNNYVY